MSYTPWHKDCPNPSLPSWETKKRNGRQEIVYWREPVEIENPRPYGRQVVHKRVWSRVGLVCLDCGLFTPDAGVIRSAEDGRPCAAALGLPNSDRQTVDQLAGVTVDQVRPH